MTTDHDVNRQDNPLFIYGCGGFGQEVALAAAAQGAFSIKAFLDDGNPAERDVLGIPVLRGLETLPELPMHAGLFIAIGNRLVHRSILDKVAKLGKGIFFPNIIHPHATADLRHVRMGRGNYIAAGARLTSNVQLGDFNIINLNCVVAHDVEIGSYCQVNPGAILNGQDTLGDNVVIGAGGILMPRIKVGDGATVAIGAVVIDDVAAEYTVGGNPARVLRRPAEACA